jgi:prepilin-type N-terminal cleavage/methylation domain-containing protein
MSCLEYNRNKGFTLIELIMVMVLVGILAVPAAYILMNFVQNSVYVPSQLNTEMALADAVDLIINGDSAAKGLRFSQRVNSISEDKVRFTTQDGDTVRYRLDEGSGRFYRKINGSAEQAFPPSAGGSIVFSGLNGVVFTYFDSNESLTNRAGRVRRVGIALQAREGQGLPDKWEGLSQAETAVAVPRYQ